MIYEGGHNLSGTAQCKLVADYLMTTKYRGLPVDLLSYFMYEYFASIIARTKIRYVTNG